MDIMFREFGNELNIAFRPFVPYSWQNEEESSTDYWSRYDDVWRRQRKVYHVRLNAKLANNYLPYQVRFSGIVGLYGKKSS